ncbi:MAG: zincin-like metallopeptidase domain-containing protein [Bacteroidota bacterium]|nr:zincin-like metallopeptidase domain-containing protein [Bacteroidota bacterium]
METAKPKPDVYQMVTDRIIAELEKGIVPWKQSWAQTGIPQNLITKRPYRGINIWLLLSLKYDSNYFLSYNQALTLGGKVKKGEKACPVVFWKRFEKEDEATKEKKYTYMLRYYNIFNITQCEGIPESSIPVTNNEIWDGVPIQICEEIVAKMPQKPVIKHEVNEAYYVPLHDYINMPKPNSFKQSIDYYNTLFHELIHSTGHQSRLNRKEIAQSTSFGSEPYSQEELVAEIGACYLNSVAGTVTESQFSNNVAYLQNWLKVLKNDKRFIIHASAKAQLSTDFILNQKADPFEMPKVKEHIEYEPVHD